MFIIGNKCWIKCNEAVLPKKSKVLNLNFDSLACAFKTQYLHKKINRSPIMHSNQKWETQSLHKKITRVHVPFMYSVIKNGKLWVAEIEMRHSSRPQWYWTKTKKMKSINWPIMNVLYISKSSFMNCTVRRFLKVYIKFYDGSFKDLWTENVCLDIFEEQIKLTWRSETYSYKQTYYKVF